MTKHIALMVPGASAAGTLTVNAPFDGTQLATLDTLDAEGVETALTTAHKLFSDKSQWLTMADRITILEKTADIMSAEVEALAVQAAAEGGKPLLDSRVEVNRAIDGIKLCIETLRTEAGHVIPMRYNGASQQRVAFTQKEPIGVVVAVSAFNHPLNLIVHQVAPAIAVGCPVIVKPAEDTPISCARFVQILHEAGLPQAWCQVAITNSHEEASQLVTDSRVGFFSFIGSARVGWMLRSKLAAGTRCALEHGGVAPVIVGEDADLDEMLPLIAKGGFYHAGQVCVSVQRVFAPTHMAKDIASALSEHAGNMAVGDPTDAKTEVGPLIRHGELTRIDAWVSDAVKAGATLVCGGEAISASCYKPTVLLNPPKDADVSTKEIFGPVVCVYGYDTLEEAIATANDLPFAFQASVFTKNIDTAFKVSAGLNASAVMVNDHTAFRVDGMPFAGLRQSGLGVGGIAHTMHDMQIEKMMVIKSTQIKG